ncbi:MAG: hypothetical protein ABL879_09435 [Devosia sp.]
MLFSYITVMNDDLPFSIAWWGMRGRVMLALLAVVLIWIGIGMVL